MLSQTGLVLNKQVLNFYYDFNDCQLIELEKEVTQATQTSKLIDDSIYELTQSLKKADVTMNEINKLESKGRAFKPVGKIDLYII